MSLSVLLTLSVVAILLTTNDFCNSVDMGVKGFGPEASYSVLVEFGVLVEWLFNTGVIFSFDDRFEVDTGITVVFGSNTSKLLDDERTKSFGLRSHLFLSLDMIKTIEQPLDVGFVGGYGDLELHGSLLIRTSLF